MTIMNLPEINKLYKNTRKIWKDNNTLIPENSIFFLMSVKKHKNSATLIEVTLLSEYGVNNFLLCEDTLVQICSD
jgi:hypothetical protein